MVVTAVWFDINIDHADGSGVSAGSASDATLTFIADTVRRREHIDALYARRAGRGLRVTRHVTTNLHVRAAADSTAEAVSSLCLFAEDGESPRPSTLPAMIGDVID